MEHVKHALMRDVRRPAPQTCADLHLERAQTCTFFSKLLHSDQSFSLALNQQKKRP